MKYTIFLFILLTDICIAQYRSFPKIAFGKGMTSIYIGSGAVSRHIDWTKFKKETESYKRSPFISLGFDKCILPYSSNAYWGLGLYASNWIANREYVDNNNRKENVWSNTLIAIRVSHHNTYYVREKLDMCSGFIVGTRMKYYHSKTVNEQSVISLNERTTFYPAFGLTFTVRYYFYKNIGLYIEACLGYKTDIAGFGLVYKLH